MGGVVSYTNIVKHRILRRSGGHAGGVRRGVRARRPRNGRGGAQGDDGGLRRQRHGVAGPDRDERGNAVGTVFIGFSSPEETIAERFDFGAASRAEIREEAADEAFKLLEEKLKEA